MIEYTKHPMKRVIYTESVIEFQKKKKKKWSLITLLQ